MPAAISRYGGIKISHAVHWSLNEMFSNKVKLQIVKYSDQTEEET